MPPAHRKGDICSGHSCYGPRDSIQGSPNVFINNKPAHRVGDMWNKHGCPGVRGHKGVSVKGSSTVFTNYKPQSRIGDLVSCGSVMATGSPNVFVGG